MAGPLAKGLESSIGASTLHHLFDKGPLTNSRSLDIFYFVQIETCIHRTYEAGDASLEDLPGDFDAFRTHFDDFLHEDIWTQYYSPEFLAQPASTHFYRLPNLQDLIYTHSPMGSPRDTDPGHFTKLPRWAACVAATKRRQPTLPVSLIRRLAISTLQETIESQRTENHLVRPYSETQTKYWLNHFDIDSERRPRADIDFRWVWRPHEFGLEVARGHCDIWKWEELYSPKAWASSTYVEPDLDGSKKRSMYGTGFPDGGTGYYASNRGWEPEVGSEEEVAFLTAVAVKETEGVDASMLDYSIRSHMLLAVLYAAFSTHQDAFIDDLAKRVAAGGRLETKDMAEQWIREALKVMEPYISEDQEWPTSEKNRSELLRRILLDNGQLFARWGWHFGRRGPPKACVFNLGPGK